MKQCKSCKKEIEDAATKCPYCQGFQNWYKNPQYYSLLFVVPLISYSFWNLKSFDSKNYLEFKGQIEAESVSNRISEKNLEFTYKIKNSTKYKWDSIKYQMIGYDSLGKIVTTKNGGIYEWLIQPKSNALITLEIPNESNEEVKTWKFEIIDLRTSRF